MFSCCSKRSEKRIHKNKAHKTKQKQKKNVYLKTKISYDNHLE